MKKENFNEKLKYLSYYIMGVSFILVVIFGIMIFDEPDNTPPLKLGTAGIVALFWILTYIIGGSLFILNIILSLVKKWK